jgi:RpiR family transcriptional regulator, carbohydrate utilization regulator
MNDLGKSVMSRIRANFHKISNSERRVAEYILSHPEESIHMSLIEIAEASMVSDATVVRLIRSIGFTGLNELKMTLAADSVKPAEAIFEEINDDDDISTIIRKIFLSNIQLLQDTLNYLKTESILQALEMINSAQNIYIFAVATSAPLANILYNRIFRLGYRANTITDAYLQLMQSAIMTKDDLGIIISHSGTPVTLVDAIKHARNNGAKTIAITCDSSSAIARTADVFITGVTREVRSDIFETPVSLATILDVLYTGLQMYNKTKSTQNQNKIWNALSKLRS